MTSRPSTAATARYVTAGLAAFAFLAVLLGAYAAGYYRLGVSREAERSRDGEPDQLVRVRFYDAQWQATLFRPATSIEELITGNEVRAMCWPEKSMSQPGAMSRP